MFAYHYSQLTTAIQTLPQPPELARPRDILLQQTAYDAHV